MLPVRIFSAVDGEQFWWVLTRPDETVKSSVGMMYRASDDCWVFDNGWSPICNQGVGHIRIWVALAIRCATPMGEGWRMRFARVTDIVQDSPFSLVRSTTGGALAIEAPIQEDPIDFIARSGGNVAALFQLTAQNYTATEPIPFSAVSSAGGAIDWTASLSYDTSAKVLKDSPGGALTNTRTFQTGSGNQSPHTEVYQSMGGQVKVTATTTASDGDTVRDCITVYVEGPETPNIPNGGLVGGDGIPNDVITPRLVELYTGSKSYPDVGAPTNNLMTGIGMRETVYRQFVTPKENPPNPDLWELNANYGIPAKWPTESAETQIQPRGANIGLMQVKAQGDVRGKLRAWDWEVNTKDAIDLFSGTPTDKSTGEPDPNEPNKISIAKTHIGWIINGKKGSDGAPAHKNASGPALEPLTDEALENMALVLYSGMGQVGNPDTATTLRKQYYIPVCPPPGSISAKGNTWTCTGTSWYWAVNDPAVDANVRAEYIFPPGVTGDFGNHAGVVYVSNGILLNDPERPAGVRAQLQ